MTDTHESVTESAPNAPAKATDMTVPKVAPDAPAQTPAPDPAKPTE